MGLADRAGALAVRSGEVARAETRGGIDTWISDYLLPSVNQFAYGGHQYAYGVNGSWGPGRVAEISNTLQGYSAAMRVCPPAFAAEMVRAAVLSQARFIFRSRSSGQTPRKLFGNRDLSILERPWTNATQSELIARMEWHAGLAGNAYVVRRGDQLQVLRPDWVAILYGSNSQPDDPMFALDRRIIGYVYANGGLTVSPGTVSGMRYEPETLLPDEVAHWSPIPDPEGADIGQSWFTPAIQDTRVDKAATEHKIRFFTNGATPNLVIKGIPAVTQNQFNEIVEMLESRHAGVANAFKTLYLTAGADATVVGSNWKDMDLKNIQGGVETRIAMLSRVPAPILQIAEGLAGSSLNAGNFGMARRIFADTWVYPTLQDLCSALSVLVKVPGDAELWFDTTDMPLLRDDAKDLAEIIKEQMLAMESGVRAGWKPDAVVRTVMSNNPAELLGQHTGLFSVQMQQPGASEEEQGPIDFGALRKPGALEAAPEEAVAELEPAP